MKRVFLILTDNTILKLSFPPEYLTINEDYKNKPTNHTINVSSHFSITGRNSLIPESQIRRLDMTTIT